MKKNTLLYILIVLLVGSSACQKGTFHGPALDLNANVKIENFTVGAVQGTINDSSGTISLVFPFGQDRSAVIPTIKVPSGASVTPASGETVNLTKPIQFQVFNGNLSNKYIVSSSEEKAVLSFIVDGDSAQIDNNARTITVTVPSGTNLTSLAPTITLAGGATISPAVGQIVDFTNPVTYKVTMGGVTIEYTVTITTPEKVAFLSIAATPNDLSEPDEKAAWNWLRTDNPEAQFVSFDDVKNGKIDLSSFTVVWWHEDSTQNLPAIAFDPTVLSLLKNYYNNGGSFLLTTYGALYVEALGIVPAGKGPNNAFGDARGNQSVDLSNSWGISFKGHESHPAFAGLTLTSDKPYATAYLLSAGAYRLNHTAQWYIPDWGGYGTAAGWREQTGGIDLGSTEWDSDHASVVTMAEFPRNHTHGAAIVICGGCYDWYSEANPANPSDQPVNIYLSNIQKMTQNILGYLSK